MFRSSEKYTKTARSVARLSFNTLVIKGILDDSLILPSQCIRRDGLHTEIPEDPGLPGPTCLCGLWTHHAGADDTSGSDCICLDCFKSVAKRIQVLALKLPEVPLDRRDASVDQSRESRLASSIYSDVGQTTDGTSYKVYVAAMQEFDSSGLDSLSIDGGRVLATSMESWMGGETRGTISHLSDRYRRADPADPSLLSVPRR